MYAIICLTMAMSCSDAVMKGYKSLVDCQIEVIRKAKTGEMKVCGKEVKT